MGQNLIIRGDLLLIVPWKYFREHNKKTFTMLWQILAIKGVGEGVDWIHYKRKIHDENLFFR